MFIYASELSFHTNHLSEGKTEISEEHTHCTNSFPDVDIVSGGRKAARFTGSNIKPQLRPS
jgi:hypothetical protein